jgi:hypothetical protein
MPQNKEVLRGMLNQKIFQKLKPQKGHLWVYLDYFWDFASHSNFALVNYQHAFYAFN